MPDRAVTSSPQWAARSSRRAFLYANAVNPTAIHSGRLPASTRISVSRGWAPWPGENPTIKGAVAVGRGVHYLVAATTRGGRNGYTTLLSIGSISVGAVIALLIAFRFRDTKHLIWFVVSDESAFSRSD